MVALSQILRSLLLTARRTLPATSTQPSVIGTATVDLNYTTYEGLQLSNGVNAFWGMRYAAPPLGELRWRAPREPVMVEGVQSAKTIPPLCLGINRGYPSSGESEDCLFVNVWAPSNATQTSKLPVWLFIQGGGYVANTNGNWDGNEVVEKSGRNIVMVNFNYRVGLWGFLASERVRGDGVLNAGLLDQRLLLKWVQTHIASFGGDPSHVVIHGASAGAGSVATHLVAYGGRNENLFIGGISQSLFFPAQPYVRELEYQFDRVVSQAGCDNGVQDQDQMACLRGKDTAVLQGANVAQPFPGRDDPPIPLFYWAPCVDGEILTDVPYRLFEKGEFLRVPMVVGTNANEGATFAPNAASQSDIAVFFRNNYPLLTANDTDDILAQYPLQPPLPQHEAWFPSASQAYGEATFICPSQNVLSFLQQKGNGQGPAMYAYRFEVLDQEYVNAGIGVPHLFDAPAIFGPHAITAPTAVAASYSTYNAAVVPRVMAYYLSFVRALDPNVYRAPGAARWEVIGGGGVDAGRAKRLVIRTEGSTMEETDQGEWERCGFWSGLAGGRMRQR
ncbi:lipase 1 [Dichotomopilus funicola]|uniref:Carboxylic ester hydrolase n=1 Tax=Dichotomopilus funicola TaxID=1934379 RepID=A0AAN6ZLZ2_9PEZI|nr:lipase 1 [Dichotomopilus funicola]